MSALAARDYFNPSPDQQDPFVRNDFGFSLGGPIKKDQTFFFVNSEWQRYRTTLTEPAVVPTAAFKTGIFNYNGQQINLADPSSPNNVQGLTLDPTIQKMLSAYPNPNGPAVDDLRGDLLLPKFVPAEYGGHNLPSGPPLQRQVQRVRAIHIQRLRRSGPIP